jgi:tripartite-type tricarboxylate transporter receptor subunit TctC
VGQGDQNHRHHDRVITTRACILLGAVAAVAVATATAQTQYPAKPIRLIVPFPAGGASDFTARTLAHRISANWRQQVIVDNRPGATGLIGMQLGAKAAPDGYTLLFASSSTFATAPSLTPNLPYDPVKDFAPIALVVHGPNVLTAHPSLPVQSLMDLIQLAKAKPGQIAYASPGVATASHMAGVLFARGAGIDLLHVPYKGGGIAVNDVVGGQVHLLFGSVSTSLPLVRTGRLRALAVTSAKRVAAVPEVPTIAESGLPGYEVVQWFGIAAPAGLPRAIVTKLNQELVTILTHSDAREALIRQGLEPVGSTPDEFAAYIKSELAKWTRIFKEMGLQGEQPR